MSKRYWSIVAGSAGIACVFGGVWYGLAEQSRYSREAELRASEHARHAAYEIEKSCDVVVAPRGKAKCLRDAVSEYRLKADDNRRDYDDLVAQQSSALWAFVMGISALFGLALSVLGVVLVWLTFREQRIANADARKAALDSAEDTRRAIEQAEISANAATRQVEISELTAKGQLRAYVGSAGINATMQTDDRGSPEWITQIEWRNSGSTPAYNVVSMFTVTILAAKSEEPFEFKYDPSHGEALGAIAPNQSAFSTTCLVPFGLANEVRQSRAHVVFWGWVEYSDVFTDSPRRRTEVACVLKVNLSDGRWGVRFEPLPWHNGMDDDCGNQPQTEA